MDPLSHIEPSRYPLQFDAQRSCRTCTHSIGWGESHTYCELNKIVAVYPCGKWERGAGCDPPE